ncbi:DUF4157 domain-containing protein [Gloeothece verrucosa]|uniref:OmpA/MotB domain-containing protein n=1 Tax=Gloeothece verrucosa (strain PCC 7822) TaxID=497965 RepID=E0UE68_GLOV7|nr:DUF4157 domain-containing protein [Gloeothece verrucosa]ADN14193.1 OmpA/MotB domain-containing protein [Gloeothece verrucosa PCC 7822]
MNFSAKMEKPLLTYSVRSPSLTKQRKTLAVEQYQQKSGEMSPKPLPLQTQMETAARLGHHLSQIEIVPSAVTIAPKLTIGQPNDPYEQEADRVAQQVMTMPEAKTVQRDSSNDEQRQTQPLVQRMEGPNEEEELKMKPLASSITPLVQRMEGPNEEEELKMKPELQREMEPEEEEVQTKSSGQQSGAMDTESLEQQLSYSQGAGSPLEEEIRSFMEPRFGADFSQVRVHHDSSAHQMNQSIQAQAFTHGKDIYFNAGKYSPSTDEGKTLLAHELTHVVQQTGKR